MRESKGEGEEEEEEDEEDEEQRGRGAVRRSSFLFNVRGAGRREETSRNLVLPSLSLPF